MQHAAALAKLRGVGWIVCVREVRQQPPLQRLGRPASPDAAREYAVVLALDLWEHAYLLDFAPSQRGKYFEMLWSSIDWDKVEARLPVRPALASATCVVR